MRTWLKRLLGTTTGSGAAQDASRDQSQQSDQNGQSQQSQQSQQSEHKSRGDAHLQQGRLEQAAQSYQEAIAQNPQDAQSQLNLGFVRQQQQRLQEAQAHLEQALALEPQLADAHYFLGQLHLQQGQGTQAIAAFRRSLAIEPHNSAAHAILGSALQLQGQHQDAIASYRQAIATEHPDNPDRAALHYNLGNALQAVGQGQEAIVHYRNALQVQPGWAQVHNDLGNALESQGQYEEAIASYRQAIAGEPGYADAYCNLGVALRLAGRCDEAIASYRQALAHRPDFAQAYLNLGVALAAQEKLDEAMDAYRQALRCKPDYAEAYCNLGSALQMLGRQEEAVEHYARALQLRPPYAEAHCNWGTLLAEQGKPDAALEHYRQALRIDPRSADAHNNMGLAFVMKDETEAAIECYKKALSIAPGFFKTHNNLGSALRLCGRLDEAIFHFRQALALNPGLLLAHSNLLFVMSGHASCSAQAYLEEALRYGSAVSAQAQPYRHWAGAEGDADADADAVAGSGPLRIGFVSGDLRSHPVSFFLESILGQLDRTRLELIAYPTVAGEDSVTARLRPHFVQWHSLKGLSDAQAAHRIHQDRIDILIDLSGHTAGNRLSVFAWKPAPVQVSWLGYFATTGVEQIDYLIGDPHTLPVQEQAWFTERIWRLPETRLCFTAPQEQIDPGPLPALENGYLTFGCFNNLSKMNDQVVATWSAILRQLPHSRLVLKARQLSQESVRRGIEHRFGAHGIDAGRLELQGPSERSDYLKSYRRLDIVLDPYPYPGGTTSAEALWMGLPVLTLEGQHFLARQGQGILANAALPDWIARDQAHYIALGVRHGSDLGALSQLRSVLRQQVLRSPLFDAARFAGHFTDALEGMWRHRKQASVTAQQHPSPTEGSVDAHLA